MNVIRHLIIMLTIMVMILIFAITMWLINTWYSPEAPKAENA